MREGLVVLNPSSGSGRAGRLWPEARGRLVREGFRFDLVRHDGLPGLAGLARDKAASGYATVVAMGGDGTVREVARGLAGTGASLAIIPAGTGNGTAQSLGLPADLERACRVAARGVPRPVDVGSSPLGLFLNVAGVGLDARITQEYRLGPYPPGLPGYAAAALRSLPGFHPSRLTVTLDDTAQTLQGMLALIGNGGYYGKGVRFARRADPADGRFDVYLVEEANLAEIAALFSLLILGRVAEHPLVHAYRARRVAVTADVPLLVHLDGDVVGETPASFELLPGRLKVLAPGPADSGQ
ncbi:MAG: diacylglycerol kinase family lipid kinase [bacterium]|nr:diacylglycerol kinase family lipid kinase [bacterium]